MTTDIIEVSNFVVLIEQSFAPSTTIEMCDLDDKLIGFSFYGSGEVELTVRYGGRTTVLNNSTGMAVSFYGNNKVSFSHKISSKKPLQTISIFSTLKNIQKLPKQEYSIFNTYLNPLVNPADDFVVGPYFFLTPDMQNAVHKIFHSTYVGAPRMMFLKSQVTELLSHFFALLTLNEKGKIRKEDRDKLLIAKDIISSNIDNPPSLSELSKLIGLNSTKLKKNFKELFGIPVFKYLQNERLNRANELLSSTEKSVQEVSWFVGYESLSSFSNAFQNKFGYRPSSLKNNSSQTNH